MRPEYTTRPIGSLGALAASLKMSENFLTNIASHVARQYTPFSIPKRDNKLRTIQIPSSTLKTVQKRINKAVFSHVKYPHYLYGGVEGKDYVKNARAHLGASVLITLDVKDFYPSINAEVVKKTFMHFCKFPEPIADLLTKLCTLRGSLVQGACTSSHIANLCLHDCEYHVVAYFESMGLTYTRLLDDICISSKSDLKPQQIEKIITRVAAFLKTKNLRLHSKKKKIYTRNNPRELMEVTGLWINRGAPRILPAERSAIRNNLFICEKEAVIGRVSSEFHTKHASLSGKVATIN